MRLISASARLIPMVLVLSALVSGLQIGFAAHSQERSSRRLVPDATLPCTPEEAKWWSKLQEAGQAVYKTRGREKEASSFAALLVEGRNNSFQPPIEDRKPIMLRMREPQYTDLARQKRVSGNITLSVELLADGTVGQIQFKNQLGLGLDENAASAARNIVFLPAVKDRKFVNYTSQVEMSFRTY